MNIGEDNLWTWNPEPGAQNLQQLLAMSYEHVTGTVRCVYCNSQQHLQFPLLEGFTRLRAQLQQQRENVLQTLPNNTGLPTYMKIANTSTEKLLRGCGRMGMEPVKPNFEPRAVDTETRLELRKIDATNILFFLLGQFLRYLNTKELRASWLRLGLRPAGIPLVILPPRFLNTKELNALWISLKLRPRRIPRAILPRGINRKKAYLVALHYHLARLLEPENAHLDLGPWPWLHPE